MEEKEFEMNKRCFLCVNPHAPISPTHDLYLADGELWVIGFSHGVIDEGGHQFSDLVQITGPRFLNHEGTKTLLSQIKLSSSSCPEHLIPH